MDLVILAGGLGSRFGGLKQLEPVDEFGNFIIDYSVFDAIRCGFDKVVFVINQNNYDAFFNTIGKRIAGKIQTEFIFQDNSNIPRNYIVPAERNKPFGTAHALLCAEKAVGNNFAVMNADDYYGFDAINLIAKFLRSSISNTQYALVSYELANTLLGQNSAKRGICIKDNSALKKIVECEVRRDKNLYFANPLDKTADNIMPNKNTPVSMNLFGLKKGIFEHLKVYFHKFLEQNKADLSSCEFYISTFLSNLIENHLIQMEVLATKSQWIGMTYKEDYAWVKTKLKDLRERKLYPPTLWEKTP